MVSPKPSSPYVIAPSGVVFRTSPEPSSAVLALSVDGFLFHSLLLLCVVSNGLFACFCHKLTFYQPGAYDHSVLYTTAQLTEGRSARDQPKQPPAKKKGHSSILDVRANGIGRLVHTGHEKILPSLLALVVSPGLVVLPDSLCYVSFLSHHYVDCCMPVTMHSPSVASRNPHDIRAIDGREQSNVSAKLSVFDNAKPWL